METIVKINGNANSNFNNMKNINVTAASQQVAGNRAEEREEKTNLRVIKIKPAGNAKIFTLQQVNNLCSTNLFHKFVLNLYII